MRQYNFRVEFIEFFANIAEVNFLKGFTKHLMIRVESGYFRPDYSINFFLRPFLSG